MTDILWSSVSDTHKDLAIERALAVARQSDFHAQKDPNSTHCLNLLRMQNYVDIVNDIREDRVPLFLASFVKQLRKENNPEYQMYLKLKEKFES